MINVFFLMIRRPPRSTQSRSSAASDVYKRQRTSRVRRSGLAGETEPTVEELKAENEDLWNDLGYMDEKIQLLSEENVRLRESMRDAEERRAARVYGSLSLIHISEPTRPY
eukprot:TRINITY_DN1660_c0_g1_i1.p1 TRINITY_DN1660_c0_g1~~TRINITY_DN1660_c0_g1_i1.p1  ORF type:complete len:111 (-),score=56.84 TRINITY_DN1660_c0_g1_i1:154-486(-)